MTLTRLKSIVSIPEYQNASSSSNSRLFASTTLSFSQNRNADLPMLVTVSGRITFSIRWLLSKALEPILVTPSGTVTTFAFPLYLVRIPLSLITKSGFSSVADCSASLASFSPFRTSCIGCMYVSTPACTCTVAGCKHPIKKTARETVETIFLILSPPLFPNAPFPMPLNIFLHSLQRNNTFLRYIT